MKTLRLMLVVLVAACGTRSGEGARIPPASGADPSPHHVDQCTSVYVTDRDTTMFTVNVEGVGVVVGAMPGDGWQVHCVPTRSMVFSAQQRTPTRFFQILRYPPTMSVPSLEAFALELVEHFLRRSNAEPNSHVTMLEPRILDEQTFVTSVHGTLHGSVGAQVMVHRIVASRAGILHYQLAEANTELAAIEPHLDVMVDAARGFGIRPSIEEN